MILISVFSEELLACELSISGCDSAGNIHFIGEPNESLASLVLAAHNKPLTSPECQALQAAITPGQWLAYKECRKVPIKAKREVRYKEKVDAMLFKAVEAAEVNITGTTVTLAFAKSDIDAWKTAKNAIRAELPYPE